MAKLLRFNSSCQCVAAIDILTYDNLMQLTPNLLLTCEDNLALMARYPDNYFELAIVDPPYGINMGHKECYSSGYLTKYHTSDWDSARPPAAYWSELMRVSQNQIVWGGNFFADVLPVSKKWIVWDKHQPDGISLSMFELAWQSQQNKQAKIFSRSVMMDKRRIHPTQKPVALYQWLLNNYAKPGDKILDTHLGSASIAIACHDLGYSLTACELDRVYYDLAIKRVQRHIAQKWLF